MAIGRIKLIFPNSAPWAEYAFDPGSKYLGWEDELVEPRSKQSKSRIKG